MTLRAVAFTTLCLLLLAGCSTWQPLSPRQQVALVIPPAAELIGTPFYPQQRYQCGPAALATVLHAQGVAVTPEALQPYVYLPGRQGSLSVDIQATARRYGMVPYLLQPELDVLLQEVAAGHPVLVLQNLGLSWLPQWHYAVVVGYDLARRELVLRSGTLKRRITPMRTFANTWRRAEHWALVILPAGQLPATAQALPYLRSAHELERIDPQLAISAYRQVTQRWPEQPLGWLALGNALYAQRHYDQSAAVFARALKQHSGATPLWNNFAYALSAGGCGSQALEALRCGLERVPDDPGLQQSLAEMQGRSPDQGGTCDPLLCTE